LRDSAVAEARAIRASMTPAGLAHAAGVERLSRLTSAAGHAPLCFTGMWITAGVIEARTALASATAESRNPRLTHLKWAKRIRELGDTLAECEAEAARLHVEHRARLLKDLRKAHTHPKFSCAAPAHLEAIDADPGLADTLKADS
jgi:hypothetical protein